MYSHTDYNLKGPFTSSNIADAETLASQHPRGSTIQIYHDPANPQLAVISRTFPYEVGFAFAVFGMLTLMSLMIIPQFLRNLRNRLQEIKRLT